MHRPVAKDRPWPTMYSMYDGVKSFLKLYAYKLANTRIPTMLDNSKVRIHLFQGPQVRFHKRFE